MISSWNKRMNFGHEHVKLDVGRKEHVDSFVAHRVGEMIFV